MSRPLRIEFPGAIYHVTSRGDRRESIYEDDDDTQTFNRRHVKVGHLFQGRFKAILVDRDSYLLEVCRYVELNPVRAGMVDSPEAWPWSSYRAHVGEADAPEWLDTAGLHGYLLGEPAQTSADVQRAARRYAQLVAAGRDVRLWDEGLNRQIYLGDDDFVARMQSLAAGGAATGKSVPKAQRTKPRDLVHWLGVCSSREEALRCAHVDSGISMTAVAAEVGLSVARVSQLIARAEAAVRENKQASTTDPKAGATASGMKPS